jgi:DNA-binding response OmpR family regulator
MPRCIMILEDDVMISSDLADFLLENGFEVAGPFESNRSALAYLRQNRPNAAAIDISVSDGDSSRTAERLIELGVPYFVISGRSQSGPMCWAWENAHWLEKPFTPQAFLREANLTREP